MKTDRRLKGLALVWLMGALTLLGNSLQARTFYVNFEHVEGAPDNGLDTNDGLSTVTSWKHAPGDPNATGNPDAVVLQGGDRVIFKGGSVYKGYIEISWSGDPGNRLVFDGNSDGSWGEGRAIIDGEGEELGINARYRGFRSPSGESHILIDNFEIRNFRYYYHSVWGEGGYGIYIFGAGTDIEIANCYLHHLLKPPLAVLTGGRRGIGKPGTAVTAATFHDDVPGLEGYSGTPGQTAIYKICLGWTRSDYDTAWGYLGEVSSPNTLTVYKDIQMTQTGWNNDDPVGHDDGYFYWIFDMRQSVAHDVGPYGIVVQTHSGVSIHDNIVQHCRMGICVWTGEGIPVSNVRILGNDISEMSVGVQSSGRVGREVSDIVISGNTLHDFFPFTKNIWGWHNDPVYVWGDTAGPVGAYDVTIANNTFYGDMRPGATALVYLQYGLSDIKIHGNVFAASSGTGYQVRLMTGPINNVGIYNNVFAKVPGDIRNSVSINGVTNATFKNNIEYLFESYSGSLLVSPGSQVGFSSDYNLLNNAHTFTQDVSFAGTIYSLEGWQAAGIHDQNSIIRQAPLFRNFPAFTAHTNADGTTERIFFQPNTNPKYPSDFQVGDHVEYEYDGVVRTVTAVSASPSYIEVTPSLARASLSEEVVLNWKDKADFTYDVRLAEGSPAIDAGADLSAEIGSLTIDGVTRPQGAGWDIGAYEYVSAVADTTSPTQPQNLTGQAVLSARIDLSWDAATDDVGVIGYRIYRDGSASPQGTSATPTYSDTGLDADTTYTYRVSAYDAAGNESPLSDPVEIHTLSVDSEPPTAPQNLKATPFSSTRIDLTWDASTDNRDVTGYRITRDGANIATTSGTDYSDTELSHSTEYSYAVLAYDAEGNESALSDSTSTRTHCILTITAENGVVTRIPDLPEYPVGTEVQLVAIPLPGHVFSAWGGDASGAANPVTIAMDSAKSVTALFTLIGGGDMVFSLMPDSEQISPVTLSGNAFSPNGMREVALWGTWSGAWQEEASQEWNALSDEILTNGGFESFSGGIATGWNLLSDGTIAFTAASDAGRSGTAQRIHVAATGSWGLFFYQTPAFELGKEYEWTLRYKTSGSNTITAEVCNATHSEVVFDQALEGTNGAWREAKLSFTYNNSLATQLRVWTNSVGTFWIDDFSLRALDESGEYPTNVAASFYVALPQGAYSWRFLGTDTEGSAFSETRNVTVYPGIRPEASIDDVAVSEGDNATTTSAIFTVSLSSATTASMSVDYALVDGSATVADNDYQSSTGTLQFPPGATTRTLTVVVRGDDSVESHETFIVNLSNPTNVTIADGQGVGTILNDDTHSGNPSVPQDLAATADSQTEIRLTWTASTDDVGVTGYRIFRGSVEIGTDADTVYLDTGLQPSTTYTYHVSAFDVDGNDSMWSAPASARTNDPPPSSTPGISISDVIVAEGDGGTRSATFDVTLSVAPTLPVTVSYATGDGTATAAGDDYVPTAGTLAFNGSTAAQIQVMVKGDIAVESNETFVVDLSNPTNAAFVKSRGVSTILNDDTGDEEAPSAPTGLEATDVLDTQIRLSWAASTDNVGVAGYRIYRDGAAIATTAEVSYEDTGLSPLTVYAYRVSAYDAAGNESPQSGPLSVQTDEPRMGEPEISISDVSLSEGNDGLVNAVFNATLSFFDPFLPVTVQYATSDGTATAASGDYDSVSGTLDFDEPLETITVPVHGDTIAEPDEILFVNLSNPSYATIKRRQGVGGILNDDTDTEAPSTSTLHALAVSDTMIYLSWTSSTDNVAVSGYRIYRDGDPIGANTLPGAAPSYVDAGLNEMTTYTYQVSAYDASGNESSMSNSASDRTGPVAPTGLRASAGDGWVHLVWDDPDVNPYGYSVYRSTVSGGPYSLLNTETHITSPAYLDINVSGGATYYYVVGAYNLPFREWPYSNEVSAAPRSAPTPTPTSTPGPPFTPTPTATVSPTSTSTPTVTATPEEPIRDLIHSFYLVLLGREPEPGAVDAWHHGYFDSAVSFNIDVRFIPREIARLFFLSEEYANRGRTDAEFITDCYRVFLNREPNPNELDAWLAGAWNRSQVMTVFSESEEFANRIAAMYPGLEGDPGRNFVAFMYIGLLDRLVDQNGLEYASGLFDAAFTSGGIEAVRAQAKQMAREVIVSEEFLGKNPTTGDYVVRFYRAFLGRFPSDTEVAYWSGELNSGRRTRDNVIDLFADSTEFTARLEEYFG